MTTFHRALILAQKYEVKCFPCVEKKPLINNFFERASKTADGLKELFGDLYCNIGIIGSSFKDNKFLLGIDVDNKPPKKDGLKTFKELKEKFEFPKTLVQSTWSGGKHLIYSTEVKIPNGVNVLGKGIDSHGHARGPMVATLPYNFIRS